MKVIEDRPTSPTIVALGANLPFEGRSPRLTIESALQDLEAEGVKITGVSKLFATPCFPAGAGPDYLNAVAELDAGMTQDPTELLQILHRVEARHGRERLTRWAGRSLDLDLITMGDSVLPDSGRWAQWWGLAPADQARLAPDELILPHPRLQDRAFVLVPMADLVPDWKHPCLGLTVREMLAALPAADREAVIPL